MSIKLGNVTINKIYLGTTPINKVYLGSTQIFPVAAAGPTVIEGFESFSGGLPDTIGWSQNGVGSVTISQSGSHVTQGSFSCRIEGDNLAGISSEPNGVNLSGKTVLKLDVHVATIGGSDYVRLLAYSVVDDLDFTDTTTVGATGNFILEIDLTQFTDITDIEFLISLPSGASSADYYLDNLRVE